MGRLSAGVPQGSVLRPLLFLVYINDLVANVRFDIKLFADDTSLFSAVYDEFKTAAELDRDLERMRLWAWQWKMKFNTEKTEEVIFSANRVKPIHPPLSFGDDDGKKERTQASTILDKIYWNNEKIYNSNEPLPFTPDSMLLDVFQLQDANQHCFGGKRGRWKYEDEKN